MNQTTKTISVSALADILRAVKGACPVTITALTDAKARKTGNPYSEVLKLARVNGMTGVDYAAAVERQQEREGKEVGFEARAPWYDRECGTLGKHKKTGELYLLLKPNRTIDRPTYFGRNGAGVLIQVPKTKIADFLPPYRSAAPSQGVDKEIPWRTYGLAGISQIAIGGQRYRVRHDGATVKLAKPRTIAQAVKRSFMAGASIKPFGTDGPIGEEHCQPEGWDGHKSEQ